MHRRNLLKITKRQHNFTTLRNESSAASLDDMSDAGAASGSGSRPTRIARACENCRTRRIKCVPPYPCVNCRAMDLGDCTVRDKARPKRWAENFHVVFQVSVTNNFAEYTCNDNIHRARRDGQYRSKSPDDNGKKRTRVESSCVTTPETPRKVTEGSRTVSRASGHERPLRDSVVRGSTYNDRTGFIRLIEQDLETVYRQITGEK